VTMRLRGVACIGPGCNADAAKQTKLLRFLKCSQGTSNLGRCLVHRSGRDSIIKSRAATAD
jgi:hypothetical protein